MSDYQLTIDTVTLGAGTPYDLQSGPQGLGLPEVRTSDTPRPQDHGLFWGNDYFGKRVITLDVAILGDSAAGATALMDALAAVWQPPDPSQVDATIPLTLDLPGQDARMLFGRPRRAAYNVDPLHAWTILATLQYDVADPRWYDAVETVLNTAAATSGGGRTYDRVYPLTYAAGGTGGDLIAVNTGNFPTRPVLTITGPSITPRVENVTAGKFLAFDLTLAGGEFLVVDTDAHTVLLGGTASRYGTLVNGSSWWELGVGENALKFTAADSQGTLEVRYRSAWL